MQVWSATVELRAFDGTSVPAGIVEISVEMLPRGGSFSIEDKLARRIALVRDGVAAADRSYFNYAKKWWQARGPNICFICSPSPPAGVPQHRRARQP